MDQPSTSWGELTLSMLKSAGAGVLGFFVLTALNAVVALAVAIAIAIGAWDDPLVASILAVVAFAVMVGVSVPLTAKRSLSVSCIHALRTTAIAPITINFVFKGLVPDGDDDHGDRGHLATLASERLPLRQCEEALKSRINDLLNQPAEKTGLRAWFLRVTQKLLLKALAKITLAELRREDSAHGGVDLHKVREKLIHEARTTLPDNLEAKLRIFTFLALTVPPATAALATFVTYWLLVRYAGI